MSKCKICEKEIDKLDKNSFVIIDDEYNCIDCAIVNADKSNTFLNAVKAFIIAISIAGILLGAVLGNIYRVPQVNVNSSSSSDSDYSYDDDYLYDDEEDADDSTEETASDKYNTTLMLAVWASTVIIVLLLFLVYFHLKNQTVLIYQNMKIISVLSKK